jgi:toluene monooxygenase system ferredoxin subunit
VSGEAADRWVAVTTLDDLWEGEKQAVVIGRVEVVVLNCDGEVFAYEDRCPHLGSRLSEGRFDGAILTCAAHEWTFEGRGGGGVNPAGACLRRFASKVEDDVVYVDVSAIVTERRGMTGVTGTQ